MPSADAVAPHSKKMRDQTLLPYHLQFIGPWYEQAIFPHFTIIMATLQDAPKLCLTSLPSYLVFVSP